MLGGGGGGGGVADSYTLNQKNKLAVGYNGPHAYRSRFVFNPHCVFTLIITFRPYNSGAENGKKL